MTDHDALALHLAERHAGDLRFVGGKWLIRWRTVDLPRPNPNGARNCAVGYVASKGLFQPTL